MRPCFSKKIKKVHYHQYRNLLGYPRLHKASTVKHSFILWSQFRSLPSYSSDPTDSICSVLLTILPDQNCSPSSITLNPGWFLVLCWSFCHNHMFAPSLFGKHYFPSFMTSVWIDVHYFTCCCEKNLMVSFSLDFKRIEFDMEGKAGCPG